jgi:hypothetical protein
VVKKRQNEVKQLLYLLILVDGLFNNNKNTIDLLRKIRSDQIEEYKLKIKNQQYDRCLRKKLISELVSNNTKSVNITA